MWCVTVDGYPFFPDHYPLRKYALTSGYPSFSCYSSPMSKHKKSRKSAPTKDRRCGTNAGYAAHYRRAESPCGACRKARADYEAKRSGRKSTAPRRESTQATTSRATATRATPGAPTAAQNGLPQPPKGLGTRGRAFWNETVTEYALTPANLQLLAEACRTLDRLDRLDGALRSKRSLFLELEDAEDQVGGLPTFNVVVNSAVSTADKLQTTFRTTIKQLGISETHYRDAEAPPVEGSNIVDMFKAAKAQKEGA